MFKKLTALFRQRTKLELITQELVEAHLEKLEAETGLEYAQSIVDYNEARITRLNKYLATQEKTK